MPSWKPSDASPPDGADEERFHPLSDALSSVLATQYASEWLPRAGLGAEHFDEVADTIELREAEAWEAGATGRVLRLTSFYTGSTYWFHGWSGSAVEAQRWIEQTAADDAYLVKAARKHGPTPWD